MIRKIIKSSEIEKFYELLWLKKKLFKLQNEQRCENNLFYNIALTFDLWRNNLKFNVQENKQKYFHNFPLNSNFSDHWGKIDPNWIKFKKCHENLIKLKIKGHFKR